MKAFRSLLCLSVLAVLAGASPVAGAGIEEPEQKVLSKEVSGQVSGASVSGLAVELEATSEGTKEIFIPVGKKTKYERVKKAADLKVGDSVRVAYDQDYRKDKDGKWTILRTTATKVSLVRKADEAGALVSREKK